MMLLALSGAGVFWLVVLALFIASLVVLVVNYRKVGPNEVLIVSGGRRRSVSAPDGTERTVGYKMCIGGGSVVLPFIQQAQILSLEMYTVQVKADEALTKGGVQLNAVGLAQVKVGSSETDIRRAAEQFLGSGSGAVPAVANQILEGFLRATLGKLTVEDIYQNRDEVNDRMGKEASEEFAKMGLQLIAFTLIETLP